MAVVTGLKFEIEFTAGVWTDVTADVELDVGAVIRRGRTSEFSAPQVSTMDFQLANHTGKYTPLVQLLTDGVTPHPYYPNVLPRKRVRASYTVGGVPQYRFVGYIKSWSPLLENGMRGYIPITANDRLDQLSRVTLKTMYEQELAATAPYASYLMNDAATPAGVVPSFADSGPNKLPALVQYGWTGVPGVGAALFTAGSANPVPQPDGLTGATVSIGGINLGRLTTNVALDPANLAYGQWLKVPVLPATHPLVGSVAFQLDATDNYTNMKTDIQILTLYGTGTATRTTGAGVYANGVQIGSTILANVPDDGLPHHYMVTCATSGGTQTLTLYVDGVSAGTNAFAAGQFASNPPKQYTLLATVDSTTTLQIGPAALYSTSLPAAGAAAKLYGGGNGWAGDLTGTRIGRYLSYAGVVAPDINLDAGQERVSGVHSVNGKDVVTACQEMATTEGGGSAFYVAPDGRMRFCGRLFRNPASPAVTFVAGNDVSIDIAPTIDDLTIVNQSTVTRQGGNAETYTDTGSKTQYGIATDQATTYATTDQAALNLAQSRVAAQSKPRLRFSRFTVDLLTALSAGLYAALPAIEIGSRLRVNALTKALTSNSQLDVIHEGSTETIAIDKYEVVFDTSPADSPARMVLDDTTYGRLQCSGQTLHTGGLTNSATTVLIDTTAGLPTFTVVGARYPLDIQIGQEIITLNSAPGGATSPQTFTGVTRGAKNSQAAAQAAGSVIDLWPAAALAL